MCLPRGAMVQCRFPRERHFFCDNSSVMSLMKDRATVVCRQGDRILLVSREWRRWALPGGAVKPGESAQEAAERELEEETSLDGLVLDYLFLFCGHRKRHHVFVATVPDGLRSRPGSEIAYCRWFDLPSVHALDTSVPTRRIVELALDRE